MNMTNETLNQIKHQMKRLMKAKGFYAERLKDVDIESIKTKEDLKNFLFQKKRI